MPRPSGLLSISFQVKASSTNRLVLFQRWNETLDGTSIRVGRCNGSSFFGCNPIALDGVFNSVRPGSHPFSVRLDSATFDLIPIGSSFKVACTITGAYTVRSADTGEVLRTEKLPDRTISLGIGESTSYTIDASR